jgi:hypothetical protein
LSSFEQQKKEYKGHAHAPESAPWLAEALTSRISLVLRAWTKAVPLVEEMMAKTASMLLKLS